MVMVWISHQLYHTIPWWTLIWRYTLIKLGPTHKFCGKDCKCSNHCGSTLWTSTSTESTTSFLNDHWHENVHQCILSRVDIQYSVSLLRTLKHSWKSFSKSPCSVVTSLCFWVAQNRTLLRKYMFLETRRSHVGLNQVSMIDVPTLFFYLQMLLYREYCVKSHSVMMLRVVFFWQMY
jgi:hypothetical protein